LSILHIFSPNAYRLELLNTYSVHVSLILITDKHSVMISLVNLRDLVMHGIPVSKHTAVLNVTVLHTVGLFDITSGAIDDL